jgi:hypothetical protein
MNEKFRQLSHRIADVIAECAYAQRRLMQLRTAPDRYLADPNTAPENYAEFVYRTSGWLEHEPSARDRLRTAGRR